MELVDGSTVVHPLRADRRTARWRCSRTTRASCRPERNGWPAQTRQHVQSVDEPMVIIVIDELAALIAYSPDRDLTRRAEAALSVILSQGRAVGYVVFAFLQDPRKETVRMRHLFTQSIGLRLRDREEVTMVLGDGALRRGARCHKIPHTTPGVGYALGGGRPSGPGPGRLRQRRHDQNCGGPFSSAASDPCRRACRFGDAGTSFVDPVAGERSGDRGRRSVMSGPTRLGELLPGTVAEMAARAGRPDFDRWAAQAQGLRPLCSSDPVAGFDPDPPVGRSAGRLLQHGE